MTEGKPTETDSSPFDELDARLREARNAANNETDSSQAEPESRRGMLKGLGLALRMATELVAAFAVGVGLGYLLDLWLGTGPFGLVVGFFLGAAAGALNVYRAAIGLGMSPGYAGPRSLGDESANGTRKE